MPIFDRDTMKAILKVTCSILHNNFYYSKESLNEFLDIFAKRAAKELQHLQLTENEEVINKLINDRCFRVYYTCYFTSVFLRIVFIDDLHFNDKELTAFESIIPKCLDRRS